MFGFGRDRDEVNGFSPLSHDSDSDFSDYAVPRSSYNRMPLTEPESEASTQRPVRPRRTIYVPPAEPIRISESDMPTWMPIRCAFCKQRGHHVLLCVKALKEKLEKVETHCRYGHHKPWFHDGAECRCRHCGIHLRHLDRNT